MNGSTVSSISIDNNDPKGYRRTLELQQRFDHAKQALLERDPWTTPDGERPPGPPELRCDLALEGGGVKGIALVGAVLVLDEAGYKIQRVAGTSAGAIAASLIAAIVHSGHPMVELKNHLATMQFRNFMPEGKIHQFIDRVGHQAGVVTADFAILLTRMGLYPGTYLSEWLGPILKGLGVETFKDLRITQDDDPGMSLPTERQFRLVVHTSDITRHVLARLPWDYGHYGKDQNLMEVVKAVRASMSIPFFFEPVEFDASEATVNIPMPGGDTAPQHYAAGTVTWVDGGMLRNFPIDAFDRMDDKKSRWPTVGIKLSSFDADFGVTTACTHTLGLATHCLQTMMNEWDQYSIEASSAARTIFISNSGITATQFDLSQEQQDQLFMNGVAAATDFVIEMGGLGCIPREPDQCEQLAALRKALTAAAPQPAPLPLASSPKSP